MPSHRPQQFPRCLVFLVLLAMPTALAAAPIDIEVQFGSFPSAQGWTYFSNGIAAPETPTWTLSGGVLGYNTMPYATNTAGSGTTSYYHRTGIITATESKTLEMRARILQHEHDGSAFIGGGLAFGFYNGTTGWDMGILLNQVRNINNEVLTSAYDNTQFHNYRFEWSLGPVLRFYVDGTLVSTDTSGFPGAVNHVFFGDATGAANAVAEITYFRFRQGDGVTATSASSWGRIKSLYR